MRKRYTKRGSVRKPSRKERRKGQAGKDRTVQLVLDREELLATMMQDSLTSFATEIGLKVATPAPGRRGRTNVVACGMSGRRSEP